MITVFMTSQVLSPMITQHSLSCRIFYFQMAVGKFSKILTFSDSNTNADITDVSDVDVRMTNGESKEVTTDEAMEQEGEFDV